MKTLLRTVAAICTLVATPLAAQEVVFSAPGGVIQKAWEDEIFPEFEAETGIQVTYVTANILDGMTRVQAQRNAPSVDITTASEDALAQFQGQELFEVLTSETVPRLAEIHPILRYPGDTGVPAYGITLGVAYNTQVFEENGFTPPSSLNDLWNDAYRGRVVLWTPATSTGLNFVMLVARAEGNGTEDLDAAFTRLQAIAPYVEFNRADEMTVLMQQGQAWLGWTNNQRAQILKDQGMPIEFAHLSEGAPTIASGWALVKNAPNRDNALALINWMLSDTGQALIAEHLNGIPAVQGVELPADVAATVADVSVLENAYKPDVDFVVANRASIMDHWARQIEAAN
ncbi:MAG: extracellular solute-binding protein [Planctomycetaceae bacterium]